MNEGGARVNLDQLAVLVTVFLVGLAVGAVALTLNGRARPAPIFISPPAPSPTSLPATAPAPIRVYISGEVIYPDVYELPSDAIMQDVVNAAGGFSPLADPNIVNLAMALSDGLHVHIPKPGSEPIIEIENNGTADSSSFSAPININTASLKQLDLLPGIGPVTAQKILDFRQANGPFSDIADIQQVSGIGPAKYDQMRELIVVR